jgi:hypothetical protein
VRGCPPRLLSTPVASMPLASEGVRSFTFEEVERLAHSQRRKCLVVVHGDVIDIPQSVRAYVAVIDCFCRPACQSYCASLRFAFIARSLRTDPCATHARTLARCCAHSSHALSS